MLALLTPKPFRGDVIAAGVVVLVTLVWTLAFRFQEAWAPGVHLAYGAVALAFVGAMATLAPMEGDQPRAYQSVLYLATISLWAAVLLALVRCVGANDVVPVLRAATLVLLAVALLGFAFSVRHNSAVCTLVGAIAAGSAALTGLGWVATPDSISPFRWLLLAEMAVFGVAAIGNRDRRPRHGVALVNAAGLAVLGIALSFSLQAWATDWVSLSGHAYGGARELWLEGGGVPWGWELLIVAAGFGLVAYSSVDRQPGPAYLGVVNLVLFTTLTSTGIVHATLVGWPLALAIAAAFLLAVGLRPTTPAPPPPDIDAPEPPPLPLR
ncbi:MAG TPA: hypothetical protein VFG42_03435 [Baekduia sp.]|uniref:hypothetical protein n=1 Tax=Baekduia sp. TaxID=2600305 RepID=UPI002D796C9B|nr:hypothetical protein [Baekduia sp.]HET6505822.1 hypothetical protein [Baekduia sp.]